MATTDDQIRRINAEMTELLDELESAANGEETLEHPDYAAVKLYRRAAALIRGLDKAFDNKKCWRCHWSDDLIEKR